MQEEVKKGQQVALAELQPMINLLEARSQGVMRSVAERDEVHMNINLRASSCAELEIIG
jgi:hypothetical protein